MLNSKFNNIFKNKNEKSPLIMSVQEEILNFSVNQSEDFKNKRIKLIFLRCLYNFNFYKKYNF